MEKTGSAKITPVFAPDLHKQLTEKGPAFAAIFQKILDDLQVKFTIDPVSLTFFFICDAISKKKFVFFFLFLCVSFVSFLLAHHYFFDLLCIDMI